MSDDYYQKPRYLSYNAMARSPMVFGIPFMPMLVVGTGAIMLGLAGSVVLGGVGWLLALVCVPILLFVKMISVTDDRAAFILIFEIKWYFVKKFSGNSVFFNGAMFVSPLKFGRKVKDVKRFFEQHFEKTISR